jgi:hypothetical protein
MDAPCPFFVENGLAGMLCERVAYRAVHNGQLKLFYVFRMINKCCYQASMRNQSFWLNWLYYNGPHSKGKPKVLKTVTLPLQVYRIGVARRQKVRARNAKYFEGLYTHRVRQLQLTKDAMLESREEDRQADLDWEYVNTAFTKRKRNRIDISNALELSEEDGI